MDGNQSEKPKKTKKAQAINISSDIFKQALKEALKKHIEIAKKKPISDTDALNATVEEFLSTFMVIGYDFDGEPLVLINAKSQKDADSLSTAFGRFFMNSAMGR